MNEFASWFHILVTKGQSLLLTFALLSLGCSDLSVSSFLFGESGGRIHQLIENGEIEEALVEIKSHPSCVNQENVDFMSPLHLAAERGAFVIVEALVVHGAEVDATDDGGRVPLHYAAASGDLDTIKVLIESGSPVNAQDNSGNTPLHFAVLSNRLEAVKFLIDQKADPCIKNNKMETADVLSVLPSMAKERKCE